MTHIVDLGGRTFAVDAANSGEANELFESALRRGIVPGAKIGANFTVTPLNRHINTQVLEITTRQAVVLSAASQAVEFIGRVRR
jgi:hypothetical protein